MGHKDNALNLEILFQRFELCNGLIGSALELSNFGGSLNKFSRKRAFFYCVFLAMDTKNKEFKGEKNKYVDSVEASKDEDDESKALLLPCKKGGLSKNKGKPKRKVQWNDTNGNKLTEVLEFQPR